MPTLPHHHNNWQMKVRLLMKISWERLCTRHLKQAFYTHLIFTKANISSSFCILTGASFYFEQSVFVIKGVASTNTNIKTNSTCLVKYSYGLYSHINFYVVFF